jgi:putative glutamine amidotransferase
MIKRIVSCLYADHHPWNTHYPDAECVTSEDHNDLRVGDILVTHGGSDISPSLYGKAVSKRTYAGDRPSHRDFLEWNMMMQAVSMDIPIIGICRGGQMLCALAGGHLIQHVNNHSCQSHPVITVDGERFQTNSIHHQMMYPFDVKHELLAWTETKLSDVYYDEDTQVSVDVEPEFVYFPQIKGFAIQWHPEMMNAESKSTKFIIDQLNARI